jgi:1-acyl-sn-glycerol-3-phosphate acyltransferase
MWTLPLLAVVVGLVLWRWRRSGRPLVPALTLGIARLHSSLWHRWSGNGPPALPATGPAIVVSNHTCSADPSFLMANASRPYCFLAAAEHYFGHPLIHGLLDLLGCVPVRRNGRDSTSARRALRRLDEGRIVCLFPEGNLAGVARGRLRAAKHGAAFLALCSRAPVIPAYITGGPQHDDLLHAWLLPSRRAVRVVYGPAIDLSAYYGRRRDRRLLAEVTELFMQRIRDLEKRRYRWRAPSGSCLVTRSNAL